MEFFDPQMITSLIFYLFSTILIASAFCVLTAQNSVHAVLFLILAFFNAAGLFLLLGAELLAMTLIIVYVGAVAVLFLFVVMMLDVNQKKSFKHPERLKRIGILVGLILGGELTIITTSWKLLPSTESTTRYTLSKDMPHLSNIESIGRILYTDFAVLFQIAGGILLLSMIGAIVLTLRQRPGVKHQKIQAQLDRQKEDTLEIQTVEIGKGIS